MATPVASPRPRLHAPVLPLRHLRVVEQRRRLARLHLFSYAVGNALFWALWAAVSVTADRWYWWATVPIAGWTLVLAGHLIRVRRLTAKR
jgi:hypothetical protein